MQDTINAGDKPHKRYHKSSHQASLTLCSDKPHRKYPSCQRQTLHQVSFMLEMNLTSYKVSFMYKRNLTVGISYAGDKA